MLSSYDITWPNATGGLAFLSAHQAPEVQSYRQTSLSIISTLNIDQTKRETFLETVLSWGCSTHHPRHAVKAQRGKVSQR